MFYSGWYPRLPRDRTSRGHGHVGRGVSRRGVQGAEEGPPAGRPGRVPGRRDRPPTGRVGPRHQD